MRPLDPVLGITLEGKAWALPWWIMKNHHAANLILEDQPVLVTLCEACAGGCAFSPLVNGRRLRLRVEGIYNAAPILMDLETASLWLPFLGQAVHGELTGERFEQLPLYQCTWAEWKARFPQTLVPDGRGESRDGHGCAHTGPQDKTSSHTIESTRLGHDARLADTELVLGVQVESAVRAYPLAALHEHGSVVNDTLGGKDIVLFTKPGSWLTAVLFRDVDELRLDFRPGTESDMEDTQTGSSWDLTGKALAGPLAGRQLGVATSWIVKWYGWSANHPQTEIFAPADLHVSSRGTAG